MSESLYPFDQANDLLYQAHSLIHDAHYKVTSPAHAKMFSRLRVLLDGIEIPPELASLYHGRELPHFGKWETTSYLEMVVLIAKQVQHLIERQHAGKGTLSAKVVQEHWEHYSVLVPLGSELFQRHALGKLLKVERSEFARRQGTKIGGVNDPQSDDPTSPRPSESGGARGKARGKGGRRPDPDVAKRRAAIQKYQQQHPAANPAVIAKELDLDWKAVSNDLQYMKTLKT